MTDRPTVQPTYQQTDTRANKKVTLPIIAENHRKVTLPIIAEKKYHSVSVRHSVVPFHFMTGWFHCCITKMLDNNAGDTDALKVAIAAKGPISVAIDASHKVSMVSITALPHSLCMVCLSQLQNCGYLCDRDLFPHCCDRHSYRIVPHFHFFWTFCFDLGLLGL